MTKRKNSTKPPELDGQVQRTRLAAAAVRQLEVNGVGLDAKTLAGQLAVMRVEVRTLIERLSGKGKGSFEQQLARALSTEADGFLAAILGADVTKAEASKGAQK